MLKNMQDGLLPEDDPLVSLELFEGPLDLLIHLIKANEIEIMDLPMEFLTRQYLQTLRSMGKMELPVAGEYFVMAAELLRIKSLMLLPQGNQRSLTKEQLESDENGPDPRSALVAQLLEYQQLKKTAVALEQKWEEQALSYTCKRLGQKDDSPRPLKPFDRFALMGSYSAVLQKLLEKIAFGEITVDQFTVSQAIEHILGELDANQTISFTTLIEKNHKELGWQAALFVATLELTRLGEVTLQQDENFGEITLNKKLAV